MKAVDLFAGAGGFTLGADLAGVDVVYAANHWQRAVDVHAANHPSTTHACQDLRQADFSALPAYDLLLASPACQGHSHAGQGARGKWGLDHSHHDTSRSTALAVVDCAEATRPKWLVVENVPQFREWALYKHWRAMLEELGYSLGEALLDAADFGVPQERRRVFIVGRRKDVAPRDVLGSLPKAGVRGRVQPHWRGMLDVLDPKAGGWEAVASKSANVRGRVKSGRAKHGSTFLTQHVTGHRGRSLTQPFPTITGADQLRIVRGRSLRNLTVPELLLGSGFPADYLAGAELGRKEACTMIGNSVCPPVAQAIIERIAA